MPERNSSTMHSFDPIKPNRAYCGTFGNGLWKTDNGGETWDNIGMDNISSKDVTSVSVSQSRKRKEQQ